MPIILAHANRIYTTYVNQAAGNNYHWSIHCLNAKADIASERGEMFATQESDLQSHRISQ